MENKTQSEALKILKFIITGALSTVLELVLFYLLQNIVFADIKTRSLNFLFFSYEGPGYLWSYLISASFGYAVAFVINRKYTFKADSKPIFSVTAYFIMVIATIFITTWLGIWITNLFIRSGMRELGEIITKPIVAVLAIVWTYPINRFVIHRKTKNNE